MHRLEINDVDTTEGTCSLHKLFYIAIFESQAGLEHLSKKQ